MVQAIFVVSVLLGAGVFLALDRYRMDLIGFCALTLLLLGGVLSVPEALSGFADPTVHMIAGLFVVGAAVFETGLAQRFGNAIERFGGKDPTKLMLTILVATASLSAFLSSTGTVALMVPVVLGLARKVQLSPSKMMIPLAYATLLGGLLTLIATAPNLVVATALEKAGYRPFSFFEFTGPGLCLVVVGIIFLVWVGPHLLPDRATPGSSTRVRPSARELWQRFGLSGWVAEVRVRAGSPLIDQSIAASAIRSEYGIAVLAVRGADAPAPSSQPLLRVERAQADRVLLEGDVLTIKGAPLAIQSFCERAVLDEVGRPEGLPAGLVVAELLVPPGSSLLGKTVRETRLRSRFDVTVLAVFRTREVLRESVAQTTLHVGDLLLLLGTGKSLVKLREELPDAIFVTESEELQKEMFRSERAPHALLTVFLMLLGLTFGVASPVTVVIAAALVMVLLGCLDMKSAERSISWETLFLIATFLPMTFALTKVGIVDSVVSGIVRALGGAGPYAILLAIFSLTALIGTVISNTATAVLVSPIAVEVASSLEVLPHPLLMTVAVASSCAFLTPVSSPVNLLVVNPGAYRFGDFARIGAPLLALMALVTLVVVPLFFPFQ